MITTDYSSMATMMSGFIEILEKMARDMMLPVISPK
jgi:hypothetical protein